MRIRTVFLGAGMLIPLLVAPGRSLYTQAAGDPARTLLEEAAEAMGGKERMQSWRTRVEKGTFRSNSPDWGHLTAAVTRIVVRPDRAKIDTDFSAYDHPFYSTSYLNGEDAWQVVNLGVRQNQDLTTRMKDFVRKSGGIGYYLGASDTMFLSGPQPPDSLLPGRSFERVTCVADGDTVLLDIDRETHLLLRQTERKEGRALFFEDYREAGGLRVPFHVSIYRGAEKAEEFLWDTITFDEPVDPTVFEENRPPRAESAGAP